MKTQSPLVKFVTFALYVAFGLLGANVASGTFHRYELIANGVLGLVIFYLIYRVFLSPRNDKVDVNNDANN